MGKLRIRRPSAATVLAFAALVAALSGTSVALPGRNGVDSGDIRNGQVRSADIRNNAFGVGTSPRTRSAEAM